MERSTREDTRVSSLNNDSIDTTEELVSRVKQNGEKIINRTLGYVKYEDSEKIAEMSVDNES